MFCNLAGVLADNNRLREILRISNAFDKLMSAARGEVTATITTAAVRLAEAKIYMSVAESCATFELSEHI